jgi:membrane protease YdiL (CAAX protease family)
LKQAHALSIQDTYLNLFVVLIMLLLVTPCLTVGIVGAFVTSQTDLYQVMLLLVQQLLWLATAWWHLGHNLRISLRDFGLPSTTWRRIPQVLIIAGILVLLDAVGSWVARSIASLFLGPGRALALYYQEQASVMGLYLDPSPLILVTLFFTTTVIVPLTEELLFRGYLHGMLRVKLGWRAIWVSSLVFTVTHLYIINALPIFLLALVLTRLYELHGNLWDNIIAHALLNAVVAGVLVLRG